MKNKNQRDLEKHWADQARKKTAAEQLRVRMEKLQEKMERDRQTVNADQPGNESPEAAASQVKPEPKSLKNSRPTKTGAKQ